MLESPAYRTLSRAAHQVLARLEIEHAHHGGRDNGALPCTYENFETYGLHKNAVAPAIREVVALGFVEVTQRGAAGNADMRRATLYRLTYRNAKGETGDGTHEWRQITDVEQAEAIAERARKGCNPYVVERAKKQISALGKRPVSPSESEGENGAFPPSETEGTGSPPKPRVLLDIGEGYAS